MIIKTDLIICLSKIYKALQTDKKGNNNNNNNNNNNINLVPVTSHRFPSLL